MDNNRKTAFEILCDIEKNGAYSNISANNFIMKNKSENPAFVREIVYGTLRNKYYLDFQLENFVKKGYTKLKIQDKTLLRMGAYQLIYMNSVPSYAACSETVNLAKKYAKGRENFINGVLRNLSRNFGNLKSTDDLSVKYSVEKWIVDLLLSQYGKEETEKILTASNETPDLSIRVNLLKTSTEDLKIRLEQKGFATEKSKYSHRSLKVKGSNLLLTEEYKKGLFSVQDQSSTLCADTLIDGENTDGIKVLDLCAAPGGKSFAVAEMLGKGSEILSVDTFEHKIELMKKEVEKKGYENVTLMQGNSTIYRDDFAEKFDLVLCDVPCSGLGVLRRKPEIKYKSAYDINELLNTQKKILENGSKYLKQGGAIVYSTCTINKTENQEAVKDFLLNNKEFSLEKEYVLLPYNGADGFYISKMRKNICK